MKIDQLLTDLQVPYRTRHRDVRQGWLGISCPECGRANEFYLGINMNSLAANCWRCGPKKLYPILRAFGATKQALATLYRFRNVAPNPFDEKELSRGKYKPPASIPLSDAPRIFSRYVNHRGM